jgi:DUF2075 family protein
VDDSSHNRIATKLSDAFFSSFGFRPHEPEVRSWRESLRAVSQVFEAGALLNQGVILEYTLPMCSKRLDCLVTGNDEDRKPNAVIIELKQWDRCEDGGGANEVVTWVGGTNRDVLHPSAQVRQYKMYLEDSHTAFSIDDPINLDACSYLHNYPFEQSDVLFAARFQSLLRDCPLFTADDVDKLIGFLQPRLKQGDDGHVLDRVERSRYRASKKLLDHVSIVIKGKSEYVLLDEQLVVFDRIVKDAEEGTRNKKKSVVIVQGGPGTGKSVIALKALGDLSAKGLNTHYVTGSRAFTKTVREIVGTRAGQQIKYFNSYMGAEYNAIDVMLCDESHRIRVTSNSRFTPKKEKSNQPQITELLHASKTAIFFVDDKQIVRPGEIGSSKYIREQAAAAGLNIREYELEAQFRCSGSDAFINWVNTTLDIQRTANVLWNIADPFEFRIFDSPQSLELAMRRKAEQKTSARLTAGFCWPWSNPLKDGTLANDVVIGEYARPWNAKSDGGRLAAGIPKESLWAYDPNGIDQIGCIYTAQGFEFDYVGVIFGDDLVYDPQLGGWKGNPKKSADSVVKRSAGDFLGFVKNTYRVLLTRGLKGCYVYFMDKATENFFRSRLETTMTQV